jgi:hypothetical protein
VAAGLLEAIDEVLEGEFERGGRIEDLLGEGV